MAASKIIVKSPKGSDFDSQLPFFFIKLKNFLEKTFVPHSESDIGLLIKIDKNIANKTLVVIGLRRDKQVEITSGISEGDIIVAEGLKKVRPRGKIKPIKK